MAADSSGCCVQGAPYRAAFHMDLCYQVEGQPAQRLNKRLGYLPIMVKSRQCYLRHLNRSGVATGSHAKPCTSEPTQ